MQKSPTLNQLALIGASIIAIVVFVGIRFLPGLLDDRSKLERQIVGFVAEKEKEAQTQRDTEHYRKDYLGNVSHELKTPLYNIQGYLDTLIDTQLKDPEISIPFLERAAQNVDRLTNIVHDLEVISQLETGKLIVQKEKFELKKLSQEVLEDLEFIAFKDKISLSLKVGFNSNTTVLADRERIRQVLTNLTTNSIKYGKANGKTEIILFEMDNDILVEITDDGIGIESEHLPRLFERFYRVDKSRSRSSGGTGLGLAIVKHILEGHEKSIHVRSIPNMGSTFTFTLDKYDANDS